MKDLPKLFSPLYVIISGSLGMIITFAIFFYNFPDASDKVGMAFVTRPEYVVWTFLHAVMSCVVTVSIIPLWNMLFRFVSAQIKTETPKATRVTIFNLVLSGFILTAIIFAVLGLITALSSQYFDQSPYIPKNLYNRFFFIYGYTTLASLPALLGILSIHTAAQKTSVKIDLPEQTKENLFELRDDLLQYRSLLQVYLLVVGTILSMASITGVGFRAIFVGLDASGIENFPVSHALIFGLFFTILLLLVYTPVHLTLTETSQKLRDNICPITSIETLPEVIAQRKYLDEMLQIDVDLISNFKHGFMTLAPFVSSLFVSIVGDIKL
jgi:hypothetical protein